MAPQRRERTIVAQALGQPERRKAGPMTAMAASGPDMETIHQNITQDPPVGSGGPVDPARRIATAIRKLGSHA